MKIDDNMFGLKKRLIEEYNKLEKEFGERFPFMPFASMKSLIRVIERNPDGTVRDIERVMGESPNSSPATDTIKAPSEKFQKMSEAYSMMSALSNEFNRIKNRDEALRKRYTELAKQLKDVDNSEPMMTSINNELAKVAKEMEAFVKSQEFKEINNKIVAIYQSLKGNSYAMELLEKDGTLAFIRDLESEQGTISSKLASWKRRFSGIFNGTSKNI